MIEVVKGLWIGNSDNSYVFLELKMGALLNVACDLSARSWPGTESAHVGLIDGPGNEIADYSAAILTLHGLRRRNECVLVYDHDGTRAFVVVMMYLNLIEGKFRANPLAWSHWLSWEDRLAKSFNSFVAELYQPHKAHVDAFERLPWGVLEALI